ncbi:hypothetical protein BP5796_07231 [Coleophoma crateriformis]|uniref:Prokaryotic-type class I peptide chain release factors domain-containing protein n=1 Tax=Coleophoma crateriformis TaxID=565419 RepID=A0A3D8RIA7_9HELO|nr:hypothetical protein BP5796_07231 [Coleophoma crateriformis]
MVLGMLRRLSTSSLQARLGLVQCIRAYTSRGPYGQEHDAQEIVAARAWYSSFNKNSISRKIAKTTYSNASGPGGQKTNKTSSKATTKWPVDALISYIPKILHPQIKMSRYYTASSNTITIQCDTTRSQSENTDITHDRLFEELGEIYRATIPGETSPEQSEKVRKLQAADNAARLKMKKMRSDKKRSRSGGGRFE